MNIRYNALLSLSGGKDSCYLAYKLAKEGKVILAFTANLDILNEVARQNIRRVVSDLNIDHISWRANQEKYIQNIESFLNEKKSMKDICTQCSVTTQGLAILMAKAFAIKDIYLGFNKYNYGGSSEKVDIGDFVFHNPLHNEYPLKEIEKFLKDKGIKTDPTKTNCVIIEKIIQLHKDRFGENPFQAEIDGLYKNNLITKEEKEKFEQFGENNTILEGEGVKLVPTKDMDYLLELVSKYRYEKVSRNSREFLHKHGFKFWKGYYGDKPIGVGYIAYHPRIGFTLDGYKDPSSGLDKKYSYILARLVADYFLEIHPELWTTHDIRNRAATLMCKRIGFKVMKELEINGKRLIVLRRTRWE